jgi:ribose 5-phosphate isomerase B
VRIACGFDHAGVPLRVVVLGAIEAAGHEPLDLGTDDAGTPDDYPDRALAVARAIRGGEAARGVLCCGSGAGVAVAASKLDGVRAAMAHDTYTARQCVEHDDVNVLALGARVIGPEIARELVVTFVSAEFSGEERHVRRLDKIAAIERGGLDADL